MKPFLDLSKSLTKLIDDPIERLNSQKELYSHMLDMYDDLIKQGEEQEIAVAKTLISFNVDEISADLKDSHIHRLNKKKLFIFVFVIITTLVLLYLFIYWMFA